MIFTTFVSLFLHLTTNIFYRHVIHPSLTSYLTPQISNVTPLPPNIDPYLQFSYHTITILYVPILEELIFRSFLLTHFDRFFGPTLAILSSSLLFGLVHYSGPSSVSTVIQTTLFSIILSNLYLSTQSIYPCILLHIINNSIATFKLLP